MIFHRRAPPSLIFLGGNQQGGLLVYQGDDNYIKLGWECNGSSTRLQQIHESNGSIANTTYVAANNIIASSGANANTVWLRIVKSGTTYRTYYSPDGNTFTLLGTRTASFSNIRVGLYSNNGSGTTTDLNVAFDYFRVTGQ